MGSFSARLPPQSTFKSCSHVSLCQARLAITALHLERTPALKEAWPDRMLLRALFVTVTTNLTVSKKMRIKKNSKPQNFEPTTAQFLKKQNS